MKLISWNVNGLRACGQGLSGCLCRIWRGRGLPAGDETAAGADRFEFGGVSAVLELCGEEGLFRHGLLYPAAAAECRLGIGKEEHSHEGRAITLEFPQLYLVNLYVPNAQEGLARIDYRMQWEDDLRAYVQALDAEKPVVICGDFNVAAEEIDLKNPKSNRGNAGFSDQERDCFRRLLAAGFADSFRRLYPDRTGAYSWWSYRFKARQNNAGWRIDYFLVSERLMPHVKDSFILPQVMGSDHCPVGLELDI